MGSGVGHGDNLAFVTAHLFSDAAGRRALQEADETIRKLPGLSWFDLVVQHTDAIRDTFEATHGPIAAARHPDVAAASA